MDTNIEIIGKIELAQLRLDQRRHRALLRLWATVTGEHQADTIRDLDELAAHNDGILAYAAEVARRKSGRAKRRRGGVPRSRPDPLPGN